MKYKNKTIALTTAFVVKCTDILYKRAKKKKKSTFVLFLIYAILI